MKVIFAAVVVLVLLVLRVVWSMRRKYSRLLSDDNFTELLGLIPSLKKVALERLGEPLHPPDDPRIAFTQAGLAVFYSVEPSGDGYLHHLSFSHGGGSMAFAAGGRFMYVTLSALGTLGDLKAVAHTRGGVTHGVFQMSEIQEREYVNRAVMAPEEKDVLRLKEGATRWLDSVRTTGQLVQSEDELLAKVGAT